MATNTKYRPGNSSAFDSDSMTYNAKGISASPTINTTTNIDMYFSDDHLLTGFWVICNGATLGDKIDIKVVDTDNIFGMGAGTVIRQFGTDLYIPVSFQEQFDVVYPAKVYAGLTLRVVYHSTATTGDSPFFAVNWKVHKVLV